MSKISLALISIVLACMTSRASSSADLAAIANLRAGADHTCAIAASGAVKCWGANFSGELGYGPTTFFPFAVNTLGLGDRIASVAAGFYHTCALTRAGGVKCWGSNANGELGDGSSAPVRTEPVDVVGLASDVTAISAATEGSYTCALTTAGGVKCWGMMLNAPGNDAVDPGPFPRDIPGLTSGVAAISVGGVGQNGFACALRTTGAVLCWGYNIFGQLGDGTFLMRGNVAEVMGLPPDVIAIATGIQSACALLSSGAMKCWGGNGFGEVGDGTFVRRNMPVDVAGLAGPVKSIFMGGGHSCALIATDELQCWGYNASREIADVVPVTNQPRPVTVAIPPATRVAMGTGHICALLTSGRVLCWGRNFAGQAGVGERSDVQLSPAPVIVRNLVVTEFYNSILDSYFLTSDPIETSAVDSGFAGPGWTRTGGSFKSGGDTDVCRFYGSVSPGPNSHFYAADGPECNGLFARQLAADNPLRSTVKNWTFEIFDFTTTATVNGECPASTVPVYRAYNDGFARGIDSNHRITTSQAAIAEVVARGWIAEGVVMCAPG